MICGMEWDFGQIYHLENKAINIIFFAIIIREGTQVSLSGIIIL